MMMKHCIKLILSLIVSTLFIFQLSASAKTSPMPNKSNNPEFASILQKIMPAVVNIIAQGDAPLVQGSDQKQHSTTNPYNPYQRFQAVGSGVVVDANNGYIVTNAHVIRHADVLIVSLSDGRKLKARKIGEDSATDIAVVQVYAKHLQGIPLANSNDLKVGDFVAAIGNPFGLQQTVTSGMVSALNRSVGIEGPLGYENFIQTDASINPGNSGGALINTDGQLVGINTAILAPLGGNIGIGFSIPSNMVHNVTGQLIKYGKVQRGMLGVMVQDLTPDLADAFKIPEARGALVTQLSATSPALLAGFKPKDVIQYVNGEQITNAAQLRSIVGTLPIGTKLDITVLREQRKISFSTKIQGTQKPTTDTSDRKQLLAGVRLSNFVQLDPQLGSIKGVLALQVDDSSNSWLAGLRPGDVIITANELPVIDIDHLTKMTNDKMERLLLKVRRGDGMIYIVIS
jgi:serine protease Do